MMKWKKFHLKSLFYPNGYSVRSKGIVQNFIFLPHDGRRKKRRRAAVDTCGLDFYPHDDAGRLIVWMLFRKEASGSKCERHFAKVGEI